jgi:ribosome-binding ATPase YchF (GTP1/OBG family)
MSTSTHLVNRHTAAVNLARRYTVQNEHDLMQVRSIVGTDFHG